MGKSRSSTATELVPAQSFTALAIPAQELGEIIRENSGPGGISAFDLERIKVPAGGATSWELPTLTGPEAVQEFNGIILYFQDVRSYWEKAFTGGHQPPDCSSMNGTMGIGVPGGMCDRCPLNAWNSNKRSDGKSSSGKACKELRMMFILREGQILPTLIVLPVKSTQRSKQYLMRLTSEQKTRYYHTVTRFGLVKAKNADGISYSEVDFGFAKKLTDDDIASVMAMRDSLRGVFEREVTEANVVGAE